MMNEQNLYILSQINELQELTNEKAQAKKHVQSQASLLHDLEKQINELRRQSVKNRREVSAAFDDNKVLREILDKKHKPKDAEMTLDDIIQEEEEAVLEKMKLLHA